MYFYTNREETFSKYLPSKLNFVHVQSLGGDRIGLSESDIWVRVPKIKKILGLDSLEGHLTEWLMLRNLLVEKFQDSIGISTKI